ncbi:hypothetical protein HB780_05675 (plasmid) [Rhizobium lusitanum]|nr:hypothetical protein HB780_05675 [Rhizobium lusitanum]
MRSEQRRNGRRSSPFRSAMSMLS